MFIPIAHGLILIKLINSSDNKVIQLPEIVERTIVFEGPAWENFDNINFKHYEQCDTLIIKNTNISHFPTGIHKLKNLHTIECINNSKLSTWGNLYADLLNKEKLKKLVLYGNKQQYLSIRIKKFINLQELIISSSIQVRKINIELLYNNKNLRSLNISNSCISKLPDDIDKLKNLKHLDLSRNHIAELPVNFYKLHLLKYLDLSGNKLNEIKPEIAELSKLKTLNISNNQLFDLPSSFYSLSSLTTLNLSKNKFLTISPIIYKLHSLESLNLENNKLDILPIEFCNLQNLKVLKLNHNLLSSVPYAILFLNNLKELYISNNKIKSISIDSRTFDDIKNSIIEFKQYNMEHSDDLTQALNTNMSTIFSNLTKLDVSYNHLTEIRDDFSNLKNLETLDASYNKILIFAVKLSDWPAITQLNLCNNKLTLAPYFEKNHDVSNIELDISENTICDDNLNDHGYGLKQIQSFKFKKLNICSRNEKIQSNNKVTQQEQENTPVWNLNSLNNLKVSQFKVYDSNFIFSDLYLMKIWHSIIKWFVYDSNTSFNSEYNNIFINNETVTTLFDKIAHSGIIEQLKQNLNESSVTLITEKFTDILQDAISAKEEKSDQLTEYIFLSYIKLMFKQILEHLDKSGNDLNKIKELRDNLTNFCYDCIKNTISQNVEQLIYQYSLTYQFKNEKSEDRFQCFVSSRINFYRELAFVETYKKGYKGDMQYFGIIRHIFSNEIGLYDDVYIIREQYKMKK